MLEAVGVFAARVLSGLLCRLPLRWALSIGAFAGRVAYLLRRHKGTGYLNLKAAFEGVLPLHEIRHIAKKSLENLGRTVAEILRFPVMDKQYFDQYVSIENYERVGQAKERRRGLIFLSPHFGNWEITAFCASVIGIPVKTLVREHRLKRVYDYFNELREVYGAELIGRDSEVKELIRVLHKDSIVAIAADQTTQKGVPVTFFGRKTLAPPGFVEIARRTGSPILPVFDVRTNEAYHRIHVLPELPIHREGVSETSNEEDLQNYYHLLEDFIRRYPDQWLWEHKRWKHCFTKSVLVLTDGKAGHEAQSRFVLEAFQELAQEKGAFELKTKIVPVAFKSVWHRYLLNILLPVMLPWIRSRIEVLRPFLTPECFERMAPLYADFVVSCGSSLLSLNLLLSKENRARSVVLMKPAFPFELFRFDLIIAPRHDEPIRGRAIVYTEVTPNPATGDLLKTEGERLIRRLGLNGKRVVSVFVGGDTHHYALKPENFVDALDRILEAVKGSDSEILVTTSRRTSDEIASLIKQKLSGERCCRLVVIANESNIENVAYGMIGASQVIFVTEDSISMISEAASSGKKVVILKVGSGKLPPKFERFQKNLVLKHCAEALKAGEITSACLNGAGAGEGLRLFHEAKQQIKTKLAGML